MRTKWKEAIMAYAVKAPVMEAAYSLTAESGLVKYRCLVPKMTDHLYDGMMHPNAYYEGLAKQISDLEAKVEQKNRELEIVRWYIQVFENG